MLMQGSLLNAVGGAAARRSLSSNLTLKTVFQRSLTSNAKRPPSSSSPIFQQQQQQQRWRDAIHGQKRNASLLTDNQVIQRPADAGAKWTRIAATAAVIIGGAG
jgi:hypothetical protein